MSIDEAALLELMDSVVNSRSFLKEEPNCATADRLLEAFRRGHSAANTQPWEILIVPPGPVRERIVASTRDQFLSPGSAGAQRALLGAPWMMVVVLDRRRCEARVGPRGRDFGLGDVFSALQNLRLMAACHGLASLLVREFDPEQLAAVCHLPWFKEPVAILALGRPDKEPERPPRMSTDLFVRTLPEEETDA